MQLLRRKKTHPAIRMAQESGPTLLIGAAAGAAVVYLLNGDARRQRRMAAEKAGRYSRKSARLLGKRARDIRNRAQGVVAETRGRFSSGSADDDTLVARVRAELGHHVDRAGDIETEVENGVVTLRGPILSTEVGKLLGIVRGVRGVHEVRNQLTIFEDEAELLGRER